jgi:periplasmic divalent cation tolerance protein
VESQYVVILVTASSVDEARKIADALVTKGLAACCNIIPAVRSIYRWEGKLCDDAEVLMVIKSRRDRFPQLASAVKSLHSYQVPEIIALPLVEGWPPYLKWLDECVGKRDG